MKMRLAFLAWLSLNRTCAFITRLPECMYHGDFVKTHDAYQTGKINATIITQIIDWCVINCIVLVGCVSFNYNINTEECEILSRRYKEIEVRIGWVTGHTDIDKKTIGPTCTSLNPCAPSQKCLDTCEAPGYLCEDFVDTAVGKKVWQSSRPVNDGAINYFGSNAIDNNWSTYSSTKKLKGSFFVVDLADSLQVYFVKITVNQKWLCRGMVIVALGEEKKYDLFPINSFCCNVDFQEKTCFCNAFGRYLTIYGEKNVECRLQITEVQVYK